VNEPSDQPAFLVAQNAVSRLVYDYCEFFDTGNFDAFAALFAHGTWFMTRDEGPGAGPVKAWLDANILLYHNEPCTRHVTTNLVVEVARDLQTAAARSYITIFQCLPDFAYQPIFGGRYRDTFRLLDGRWWFDDRGVIPDLFGDMSRHVRHPRMPAGPARYPAAG